jgi:catechol 2,3-dioxygenase-like lactoylglutathione lyase family enzyme
MGATGAAGGAGPASAAGATGSTGTAGASLLIASPHRYPDLARLWYRALRRDLLPALGQAGLAVSVRIFRDGHAADFAPRDFPGAVLDAPRPEARDFVEFYDAVLGASPDHDYLFFLDADVFFLDGAGPCSYLSAFDRPEVAAVSFLRRSALPGVYALLCRVADYRALPQPVFAAAYEELANWPRAINRNPGERAALALRARGREIVEAPDAATHLADFHGTTVLRAAREVFAAAIGEHRFEQLVAERRYFAMGAYDNLLLGTLYQAVFGEPFAAVAGQPLAGSLPAASLARALARIEDPDRRAVLLDYCRRSDRAIALLAAREGVQLEIPRVIPESWRP